MNYIERFAAYLESRSLEFTEEYQKIAWATYRLRSSFTEREIIETLQHELPNEGRSMLQHLIRIGDSEWFRHLEPELKKQLFRVLEEPDRLTCRSTTVFRCLNLLCDAGLLQRIHATGRDTEYCVRAPG